MQRILDHLQNLVAMYPCTDDQDAGKKALDYCHDVILKSGSFHDITFHKNNGYNSLTASTAQTRKPRLLLQAHVDVVPCTITPRMQTAADTLTGRGVYDMLFATACYLAFIESHQKELRDLDIGVMLTSDEECGGFDGVEYLLQEGYGAEVCLLPDAGEGFGDLSIAAKGVYNFDIKVKGRAHHGSRPWEGDGAGNKLIHLLHDLMAGFDDSNHYNSTMTVTRLECGDCDNRGASTARAHLDIRYKDTADFKRIQHLVAKLCKQYNAEPQHIMLADSFTINTENNYIKEFLKLYERHANQKITLTKAHGGSDARFFAARDIPVILLRPDGSGAHSDEESLSLSSLEKFYKLLEEYVLQTAKTNP